MSEDKAARAMNRWWKRRTGSAAEVADPDIVNGTVNVDPAALKTLVMYARSMTIVAERRRRRICELQGRLP